MKWRKAPDELKATLDLAMRGVDAELFIRLPDELREATERRVGSLKHPGPMPAEVKKARPKK
jgi:hypothetical protein